MSEEKASPVVVEGGDVCDGSDDCAILQRVLRNELSEADLAHLEGRSHPMAPCRYGAECRAYQRLINRGDRLEDRSHVRLVGHPARDRYAKLPEGFSPFVYRKRGEQRGVGGDAPEEGLSDDEQLEVLIAEVKRNGYGDDLVTADGDSLLTVVDRKLAHPRCNAIQAELAELLKEYPSHSYYSPLIRAHMLALILYTGCRANYAMCAAEREGDYKSWQWFSWLLHQAVFRLNNGDTAEQPIAFSGIPKVHVTAKVGDYIWLATHTSTSEDHAVAEGFAKNDGGVILEFEKGLGGWYADVSWISKFPSEKEWLRRGGIEYIVKRIETAGDKQKVVLEELD